MNALHHWGDNARCRMGGADLSALMTTKNGGGPKTQGHIDQVLRCSALDKRVPHAVFRLDFAWKGT